jgi:hypothetical protein
MRKLSLAIFAGTVVLGSVFAPSLIARQQSAARFEYIHVTSYGPTVRNVNHFGNVGATNAGLRACVAGAREWTCRDFPSSPSGDAQPDALRSMLVTLGNEGWELVLPPVASGTDNYSTPFYFKRPIR